MADVNHMDRRRSATMAYDRQFHRWSSLRAIFGVMLPCCGVHSLVTSSKINRPASDTSSYVTGTIFGQRKGRVHFCIQEDPASPPLLLLEFPIATNILIKEMQSGVVRITLEYVKKEVNEERELFLEPVWSMYCNGRKVGFAFKKLLKTDGDSVIGNFMSLLQSVSTGAGVIPPEEWKTEEEELIYMRASYERVIGSSDSAAFHMISPDNAPGQELSVFLTRT